MSVLALIPARGGSKGIPRKNLAVVDGLPMIAHSIRHARQCVAVSRVLVSSDDDEILAVAREHGAETPFARPRALAADDTLDLPVFAHALDWLQASEGYRPELIVHLRPTAPLRRPGWLDAAVSLLLSRPDADSLRSVSEVVQHPYRMFEKTTDGLLVPLLRDVGPTPYLLRRQNLPSMWYYNCVIDITRPDTVFGQQSMTGRRMLAFELPAEECFDVDTPRDLEVVRHFAPQFR